MEPRGSHPVCRPVQRLEGFKNSSMANCEGNGSLFLGVQTISKYVTNRAQVLPEPLHLRAAGEDRPFDAALPEVQRSDHLHLR